MIRPAEPGDADRITDIIERAFAVYVPRIGLRPAPMDADHAAEIDRGESFVSVVEGSTTGVIVLIDHGPELHVDVVAIDPGSQGQGLGSELLEFADERARRAGQRELRLFTHVLMTENIAYYQRLGFETIETRTEYGFTRVFFRRPVSPLHCSGS